MDLKTGTAGSWAAIPHVLMRLTYAYTGIADLTRCLCVCRAWADNPISEATVESRLPLALS